MDRNFETKTAAFDTGIERIRDIIVNDLRYQDLSDNKKTGICNNVMSIVRRYHHDLALNNEDTLTILALAMLVFCPDREVPLPLISDDDEVTSGTSQT